MYRFIVLERQIIKISKIFFWLCKKAIYAFRDFNSLQIVRKLFLQSYDTIKTKDNMHLDFLFVKKYFLLMLNRASQHRKQKGTQTQISNNRFALEHRSYILVLIS